jgi:NAD+ diphosphatase
MLAGLPLSRIFVDRAAELRGDPQALDRARRDPATRVLVVGGGQIVVADDDEAGLRAALLDPQTAARVDGTAGGAAARTAAVGAVVGTTAAVTPGAALDGPVPADGGTPEAGCWLLLGRDDEGTLILARRVPRGRPAPQKGQPSDVLVHQAAGTESGAEPGAAPAPEPGLRWAALRDVGADLPADHAGLATMAVALDEWHARHPRCPRCGAPTDVAQAGWVRVCTQDGSEHYPRTDPAMIVAVVDDDDRILLGHAAPWPAGRFSTLAGFVEAGESAEHTVIREVREETQVVVDRVDYRGSQPWPFPASLMLAYRAHAATTDVRVDGVEMTDARWFTRAELAAGIAAGEVLLPMRTSVARALITEWFGAPLPSTR